MRTTKRIAKKQAAQFVALMFDVPFVLEHAKPSLYRLPFGTMRHYVYRTGVQKAFARPSAMQWAAWRWAKSYRSSVSVSPSENRNNG